MTSASLSALPNLGARSEAMLAAAGIATPAALASMGAINAFIALKQSGQAVSLNMLWALEGALSSRDWREVARTDRLRLLTELDARGIRI